MSTNNFQSGGGTNVSSNVQENLLGPNATGLQTFQQYQEDIEKEKTPIPEEKKFGSDYISKLYNDIDFGDLPVKNETDFVASLLYKDGFAESIFEMQKPEANFEDFMDKIAGEVYSDKNIYIDPTIPDESRDALAKAYMNPHAKFSDGSYALFGTDEWIKDALNATSSGIHTNPDDPTEYVIVKDGKYRRYRDGREDNLATKIINTAGKVVSKAGASTFDLIPELLEDVFGSGTLGEDNIENIAQNFTQEGSNNFLSYQNREVTPEEFQNMSFIDQQSYGLSQMHDPETILNWDFIRSEEGIQTLSSTLELIAPGMAGAKLASKVGVVGALSKAGSLADDVVKAAINNGKRFSYGSQLGAGLGKVIGYTLPLSVLESRMEALGTYEAKFEQYSQETLPDGTANPDYIADENERKVAANTAANEHFKLGIPNLLVSNAIEAATMMLPFNKLKQFGAIGGAAGIATGFALNAPTEGIEEITQWGIQDYINDKYSLAGKEKGLQNDSFMDSLTDSWGRSLEGFTNDPEANTAFWTGIVMGGLQSGVSNLAAKGKEQYYNIKYRDELNLINSSVNGGFGIYDVDDQGNKTINYEKLSGAAKHYADLTSNLHLTSNIDFSNEKTSSDKLSIMLGERYSSLVQNVLQNDTEGLLRELPKEDFVSFMTNELNKGFRLSPEEYEKKNFQGIRYYDWNKLTDDTLNNVLDDVYNLYYNQEAVKEAKDTGFEKADVLRIINESTGNKELDKVIASRSAGLAIGKSLTRNILGNYLSEETELPDDADPQDYIKGKNGYYRVMDPKNRAHVKELLNVYKKYDELYTDLVAISGTNLTEENKKKQADLLNRFEAVKKYYGDKKNLSKNTLGERIKKLTDTAVTKFKNRKKLDVNPLEGIFGKKKSDELLEEEAAKSAEVTEQVEDEKAAIEISDAVDAAFPVVPPVSPEGSATNEGVTPTGGELKNTPDDNDGFPEPFDLTAEAGLETDIPTIEEAMRGATATPKAKQPEEELTYDPKDPNSIFLYITKAKPVGMKTSDFITTLSQEAQDTLNKNTAELADKNEQEDNFDNLDTSEPGEQTFNFDTNTSGELIIPDEQVDPIENNLPKETDGELTPSDVLNGEQNLVTGESVTFAINGVNQTFTPTGLGRYRIVPNSSETEALLAEQAADDIGNAIAYTFTNNYFEKDNNEVFLPLLTKDINSGTDLSFFLVQNDSFLRDNPSVQKLYKTYRENIDILFGDNKKITLEIVDPTLPDNPDAVGYVTLTKQDFDPIRIVIDGAVDATTMVHEPLWFLKRLENGYTDIKSFEYTPTKAISRAINNHLAFRRDLRDKLSTQDAVKGVITKKDYSRFDYTDTLDKLTGEIVDGRILRNVETSQNKSTDSSSRRVDSTFLYDEPNRDKTDTPNTKNRSLIPVMHGSEISSDLTKIVKKDATGTSKTITAKVDTSLINDKNRSTVFTILDDGTGGYKAYPTNTANVSNQIKRTLSHLIHAFIRPQDVTGIVVELNKNLPSSEQFLESLNGKYIVNRENLKNYIGKFVPISDSISDIKVGDSSITRIGISLNTTNGTAFLGNEITAKKGQYKGLITKEILDTKNDNGAVANIMNLIDSFVKSDVKKAILPFTSAKPSSQSYSSQIPIVDGNLVKMVKYEDLIREHYYSSIEIINTGANSDQEIGFVAQRNFILNTKVGSLPAQQTATDISETKAPEIVPTKKSDLGERVHDTILDKPAVESLPSALESVLTESQKDNLAKARQGIKAEPAIQKFNSVEDLISHSKTLLGKEFYVNGNTVTFVDFKGSVLTGAGQRVFVKVLINGVPVTFYSSTGSGKKALKEGVFYPTLGIESDERFNGTWINKIDGIDMASYYGSQQLAVVGNFLDFNFGNTNAFASNINELTLELQNPGKAALTKEKALAIRREYNKEYLNSNRETFSNNEKSKVIEAFSNLVDTLNRSAIQSSNLSENPVRIVKTLREDGTIGYDLMHDEDGLISDGQGSLTLDEVNAELRKLEAFSVFESSMSKIKALEESEGVSGSALKDKKADIERRRQENPSVERGVLINFESGKTKNQLIDIVNKLKNGEINLNEIIKEFSNLPSNTFSEVIEAFNEGTLADKIQFGLDTKELSDLQPKTRSREEVIKLRQKALSEKQKAETALKDSEYKIVKKKELITGKVTETKVKRTVEEKAKYEDFYRKTIEDINKQIEEYDAELQSTETNLQPEQGAVTTEQSVSADIEAKKAEIERRNTFTRKDLKTISEGTSLAKKGSEVIDTKKVESTLSIGDKITFFAEKERKGIWDGKAVRDEKDNPWGLIGILGSNDGWLRNDTKYDAELKALEESNSASTVKPTLPTRSVNKNDVSNKRNRRNFDFSDVSDQLENNKAIPVSDLTLLDDLQSSIMGEISEKLLTATVSSESDLIELDMINEVSNDKLHTLANTLDDLLGLGESIAFPNSKPISVSDLEILIDGKNESGIPYFKLFKERIKLATQELLDMDQQKEAGLLDLDSELNEAQNRDQMNEDANRLFNPTNKVSKKEKLLYNSLVKEVDPTGTGLFTTYYSYKDIKPKVISLLSIGNDNYYEPNTQKALDILRKKDFDWIQPLLNKLTDHSKYDPQLMEVLKQQVLVFNRNLEANYMQIYVDYKTENAGVPGQEYKIPVYRVGPITADFNRREVVMDIIDTIDGLNGIVPEPISRIKETRVSEILDSIGFDLTDIDRDELNTIIKDTKYLKKEIEGIITGKKLSTSNIKKVADFISSTRKTPQLSQLDNGKSVGLFITPSQLGEDLSKFANSTRDAKIQEFSHVSAKDTLAFFKSNKLKFGIASLAFRADTDKKLSEYDKMEYIQAAFNMFFSEQNGKSWYITATPSDGGTNYLVEFENLKIKDFNVNRLSNNENDYYYNNLVKPDLDRMSAPFIHDGNKVYSFANYNPMKFYGFEKLYKDTVINFSNNLTAEENYFKFLNEINKVKTDKEKVEIARKANEFFKKEISLYTAQEGNKLNLVNTVKESLQELSDNIRKDLSDTGLLISVEDIIKLRKTEPKKAKQYTYGIHSSLIDKVNLEDFVKSMLGSTSEFTEGDKKNTDFIPFIQDAMLSTIVGNYSVFHNNMQYIFQGDPSQYAKGYNPADPQGSYDNFLGNLFKRLKSNISPRDIGNDSVKSISSKGLKAMRSGKFDPSNPEHTYDRSLVNHIVSKDTKIPGLNIAGIMEVMGSDLSYGRLGLNPDIITEENYNTLSTKEKLDVILKNVHKPQNLFPEVKDYFKTPIADAQEYWHYTYGLDFLEEQGEITNQKKLEIIQRVESDTLTKDDYKYLGVQKPLHVGTRNFSDNNGTTTEGNKWQIRDYIKSSAKFLYPQLVKNTEWEEIYNKMESSNVDAITFDSAIKVGGPSDPVTIFSTTGEYTGVDFTNVIPLSSKFKGKQLNIPLKKENKVADPAQVDAKFGPGLENLTMEDGTPMKKLLDRQEELKSQKREIEKEKIRKRLSNPDGTLNIKKLHSFLQEELNSRGFEDNAKDVVKLMQEIDPDGEIIDILMYPLHAMTQPKRFDALIASLITKAGISKGKTPGFGLPQVASVGFKNKKAKVNEIEQLGNRSIVTVGGWDLSKGLSHYSMGTDHNPKGLAEIILPWLFPIPIENFTENGKKYGKIDLNKLPEELLEGLGFRIPYQNYSSSMGFKIVGFTTDPNSVFVPHEIAIQMGSDYDIDKLYGMLPDIEAVYNINGKFNNKAQVESKLTKVQESINEILEDMLTIGEKTGKLETLKNQIDNSEVSTDTIEDVIDQIKNSPGKKLVLLTEQLEQLQEVLAKEVPDALRKSNSKAGRVNNEIHDIRMRIASHPDVKKQALQALDTGINEWFDWFNTTLKDSVNSTNRTKSYLDFNYQGSKSDNARVGKTGIGAFSLNGSTISKFLGRNVTKRNYLPVSIEYRDKDGKLVTATNTNNLSNKYDILSNKKLEEIYKKGFEGKQLVSYLDENGEQQYALLDLYQEAKAMKGYLETIFEDLVDSTNTGIDVVLADNDVVTEMLNEYEKENEDISLLSQDIAIDNVISDNTAGFYDGEKIVLNKDHKNLGIGKAVHEHMYPLLNDLDSIIAGTFDGQKTTSIQTQRAEEVKNKLYLEASEILGETEITNILNSETYYNLSFEQQQNEIIARAVEKVSNNITKTNKSFVKAMQDFISFLLQNIRSRFYRAVIEKRSFTALDLEPIVGINELANVYLVTGAAKKTMDKSGKLREATATDKTFDSIMNQIYSKGKILDIIDNSSFQDFSTRYNYDNGYNQVIPHTKPSLVDKSYNNTVYENITVDGANKVAELEASGLNPDTLNIATSMVMFGFDPKHVTIALNNPLLKEYFVRLKAREITEGWSISNQANTLAEMRNTYLPTSAIDIELKPSNFYTKVTDKDGNVTLEPNFVISEEKMFDKRSAMFNKDRQVASEQYAEILEHQFKALLVTLTFGEVNEELIGLSNLFNLNSSGGTRSFNNDVDIYDNIQTILSTNRFADYNLGTVLDDSFTRQVFENFVELRDLFSSEKGISAVTDYKDFVDSIIDIYGVHYTVGKFTPSKKRKFRDKLVNIIPEYIKSQVFSKIPTKDNIDSTKYRLLSNDSVDNLAVRIASIKEKMIANKNYPLNIEKVFFDAIETKKESKYSLVKFNVGRIAPNVKNNIKAHMLELYNVPVDLGFSDGYTSKDLIDDLMDYSIVTGANSGPGKFFDYLPGELLLRDFSKLERDFEFYKLNKNDVLLSFLMNNPDLLPGIENLPVDYTGRIYKSKSGILYKVVKNDKDESERGQAIAHISNKTLIKQYSIKASLKNDVLVVSGYNVLNGSDAPQVYQKDTSSQTTIASRNLSGVESILKDNTENKLKAKYEISDNITNKELKAAYDELMLDNDVQSVGIEIVDMIDNNPNNYARYDKKRHIITVSSKALESGKYSLSGILIHEYTHVVMSDMVGIYENIKNGSLSKDILSPEAYDKMRYIESVYETYREQYSNDVASLSLDEFISEVRRSKDVRDNIVKLPESKKKGILTRILNSITDLIREALGLSKENETISGQKILDATLDFITTLSNNKTFVYTNNKDNYTFTLSVDNSNNVVKIVHGTKNGSTLVNAEQAYNEITQDSSYNQYFLSDTESDVLYSNDIKRKTTSTYNLSVPEFNNVMKTVKTLMRENEYQHDALMDIIYKRYYDLIKTAELNKSILKNSSDKTELEKALNSVSIIEEELKRIQEHIVRATKAENTKEKMDYVDSVLDAIQEVTDKADPNPIEMLTANYFLTKLTDVFDHTKTDVTVYSPDGKDDVVFINEEAKNDPNINIKYHEQVVKITDLNTKLLSKTLDTITKLIKRRDEFINLDFNSKHLKEEIGAYNRWLMTMDRTGDPFMNAWSLLNNEIEANYKLEISNKLEEIKKVRDKAVPALQAYYSRLSPGDELDHYHKYDIYSLFLDENGNFKTRYKTDYFDALNKAKNKRDNASREYVANNSADNLKALKKAKKAYSDLLNKANYSTKAEIEKDLLSETDPVKIKEFQNALDKFDKMRSDKLTKFEVDLEVYTNSLEGSPNKKDLVLEFIEEHYPADTHAELKAFVKKATGSSYEYKIEKGSIIRNDAALMTPIKEVNKSYEYHHSVPKPEFWNDMSFLDNPDIKAFYELYSETFKEIRDNLPTDKNEALKLSDIPYVARNVLDYALKDMIMNPDTRRTVITDYVQKLVLRNNYLLRDDSGQTYNNESINTKFGKTNAFSKNTAIKERLIKGLSEAGLPIYDSLGKLNPYKANKVKGAYTKEFTEIYNRIKNEADLELAEMKSFDLSLILELYYIEAMMYKHKMQDLNDMNLIKDTAMKVWQNVKDSNGQPAPLTDKMQMLLDNDKMFKGIPARKAKGDIFDFAGKKLSNIEKKRAKDLKDIIAILEQDLLAVSELEENEENLTKKMNIIQELNSRKQELDRLGGNLHLGNMMRQLMSAHTYMRLAFNATSSVGNTLMGIISNRMEAADGRIFNMESYNKISDKIYKKSSLTPFLAGTFAGLAIAPFSMGLGAIVGYGVNRLLHKTRPVDPDTTTILNMMGMYDLVQEQGRELQLKTEATKKTRTWKNKLLRYDAADILKQNMLFINKSEIPHQAVILGSILDSTKLVNSDGSEERSVLDFLTSVGSEGMKFNTDYSKPVYLKLNTTSGPTITELPLGVLLNRIATTSAALVAKTHGNYRVNTKQLAKLDDLTVLATEFKTWAFEGFYNRYEESKSNITISKSLTDNKNQFADQDYITKGMYTTSVEKLGVPLTFGLSMFTPNLNGLLMGFIGTFSGAGIFSALPALTQAGATLYGLRHLHSKRYEKNVDPNVQKAFAASLMKRAA